MRVFTWETFNQRPWWAGHYNTIGIGKRSYRVYSVNEKYLTITSTLDGV